MITSITTSKRMHGEFWRFLSLQTNRMTEAHFKAIGRCRGYCTVFEFAPAAVASFRVKRPLRSYQPRGTVNEDMQGVF